MKSFLFKVYSAQQFSDISKQDKTLSFLTFPQQKNPIQK